MGLCTVGSEVLREVLNRQSVYGTALLGVENVEGLKNMVELNVEWSR